MASSLFSSNQKVAVVTGSSTGIGYETSLILARKWFSYLCDNEES